MIKLITLTSRMALIISLIFLISGCGAVSVENRYQQGNTEQKDGPKSVKKFDFAPYSTVPGYYSDSKNASENERKIWYSYDSSDTSAKGLAKVNGYRVQILSTDSFDEADNLKLDIHTRLHSTPVYVFFESPYYKVRVGDLIESNHAYDLSDKLKQLGYKNTLVVQDSVLVKK